MSSLAQPLVGVHYSVPRFREEGWELYEGNVPESAVHRQAVELLKLILAAWAARMGSMRVDCNLAVRWNQANPRIGVDPDVAVFSPPPPPDGPDLTSVRTWLQGHHPPRLAIEVVSENHAYKDYAIVPGKYAASGTQELWVFDPQLAGPSAHDGPHRLQIWERRPNGDFVRIFAGEAPARSPLLGAYLVTVDEGRKLRISDDPEGTRLWLTGEEAERVAKEAERAEKEAALARVAELEALLAKAQSGGK